MDMLPEAGEPFIKEDEQPAMVLPLPEEKVPFWSYGDLFLVLGLLVAAIVALMIALAGLTAVYPGLAKNPAPLLLPSNIAIYLALYIIFRVVFALRYGRPVFPSLGWVPGTFRLSWALGGGVVLAFFVAGLAALLKTPKVQSPIESLMNSPVLLVCFGVMAVTIAPLFEEMFFRGFLQPLFTRSLGAVAGIVVTAVLFGGLHAPEYQLAWQYAVAVSVVGAALGWVRLRGQSIVPSTVMHGAYNSVFVVALFVSKIHNK